MELSAQDLMAGYATYASANELTVEPALDAPAATPTATIAATIVISTIDIASTVSTWTAGC